MVNVFAGNKKKEPLNEHSNQQEQQEAPEAKNTDQPQVLMQKLKIEEAVLADEKQNLIRLKEELKRKINDQIENRKTNLQKLKLEVDALKIECAQLNESIETEIPAQ